MDNAAIKSAIATLSDNSISPYDLLIAIGKTDTVPDEIIENRKTRVLQRDGEESPEGYIKNAIEDLRKMKFKGKEQVLKVLRNNAGLSRLSGFNGTDPAKCAYSVLHGVFILMPILAGADKFVNWSTNWDRYLAPWVEDLSPLPKRKLMQLVGCVEMIAGIITALKPEIGGYIISAWLGLIVTNIIISGKNYDIALRDAGLSAGALSMAKLAKNFATPAP